MKSKIELIGVIVAILVSLVGGATYVNKIKANTTINSRLISLMKDECTRKWAQHNARDAERDRLLLNRLNDISRSIEKQGVSVAEMQVEIKYIKKMVE